MMRHTDFRFTGSWWSTQPGMDSGGRQEKRPELAQTSRAGNLRTNEIGNPAVEADCSFTGILAQEVNQCQAPGCTSGAGFSGGSTMRKLENTISEASIFRAKYGRDMT